MNQQNSLLAPSNPSRGLILFAHGSRDPLWKKPIEAVASQIRQIDPVVQVRCAYLELTAPDLPACVAELHAQGVTAITVVPMFLGIGKHAREDLPLLMATLQASYPLMAFKLRPAISEEAPVIELMARIALS